MDFLVLLYVSYEINM